MGKKKKKKFEQQQQVQPVQKAQEPQKQEAEKISEVKPEPQPAEPVVERTVEEPVIQPAPQPVITPEKPAEGISDSELRTQVLGIIDDWRKEGFILPENENELIANIDTYKKNIAHLREIKSWFETIEEPFKTDFKPEFEPLANDVQKINELLELKNRIMNKIKVTKLLAALDEIKAPQYKIEVDRLREQIEKMENLIEIEEQIKTLKRKERELFFETKVAESVIIAEKEKRPVKEESISLKLEDIFILYKDGRLMGEYIRRGKTQPNPKILENLLKIAQKFVRAQTEGAKENLIKLGNHEITMLHGNFVFIAIITYGKRHPLVLKIVEKIIQLLEMRYKEILPKWSGDKNQIPNLERFAGAIIRAIGKIENSDVGTEDDWGFKFQ